MTEQTKMLRTIVLYLIVVVSVVWSKRERYTERELVHIFKRPTLKPGVIDILDKLVKRVGIKWIKKDMIMNAMNDDDIVCMNWYWDRDVGIRKDESNLRQCPNCSLTVMCDQKPNCHSEQNCCFSYAVMDRVSKLKDTNSQCKKKSGLGFVLSIVKIKVFTSDDAVHYLLKVMRDDTVWQCPLAPESPKCKTVAKPSKSVSKTTRKPSTAMPTKNMEKAKFPRIPRRKNSAIGLSTVIYMFYLSIFISMILNFNKI